MSGNGRYMVMGTPIAWKRSEFSSKETARAYDYLHGQLFRVA